MLRSRGISQIYHTYSEDMHPVYLPLPWLHTPRSNHGSGGYMGAYPPRRCGISYTYTVIVHSGTIHRRAI